MAGSTVRRSFPKIKGALLMLDAQKEKACMILSQQESAIYRCMLLVAIRFVGIGEEGKGGEG